MSEVQTHRLVPYAPEQMFAIVADIESYPQFVPYCSSMRILSREQKSAGIETLTARMGIRYKIFEEHYTSRVTLDRAALAIDASQIEGPFSYLINTWRFEKAGEGAKIHFYLNYEFRSRALKLVTGAIFKRLFSNFSDAFEKRAATFQQR